MAAGRGEFFQSLLAGLERKPGPGGGQPGPGGGGQPGPGGGGQPGPGGGQPGGGQPGGGQPGPGGGQPGPGRRQLGPGGQPGPGGRQPGPGGRQPGPGGGQPGGGHPGPGVRQPGPGGGQPGPGVRQPGPGGGQTGPGGGQPGPGGGQPGPGGRQPGPGGGQPGPRQPGPGGGQPGPGGGGQPGPGGGGQPGPGGGQPGGGQPGGGQPGPGGGQPGPGRRQLGPGGQPGPGGRQPGPGGRQPGPGGGQPGGGHPGPGVRQPGPGGGQPGPGVRQPGPGGGQTGPGGGQPGPGGGQPGPGGRQPGPGGGQPGPRQPGPGGGQPGPGGGQPGPGGRQPGPGGGQTGGGQPGPGGGQTGGGQPGPGGGQPGPGGGQPGPGGGQPGGGQPGPGGGQPGPGVRQRGGRRRKRPLRGAPSSVGGKERSRSERQKVKTSSSRENFIERLPSEILIKILSYLDSPSLFCIGHVSKLFHRLSSDDVMWHKIYNAEFGKQVWKPKWWDEPALKVDPAEDQSAGRWKKLYFRTVAGQEMSKWRRELTDINPYTGLPKHTERVLRSLNVSWELTVCDRFGHEKTMEQSRAYFFKSSAIVCWSNGSFPKYHHISNIQLHGVRREAPKSPEVRRPAWRSLILKLDMKTQPGWFFGKDRLIKLMHLPPGFIVGIWRGQSDVAFIMVSLHLHKLVEKSLLGSPVCPYSEPADLPPVDDSDPEFGLHGYTLHFVLHNTGSEIMLGHFCKLSCHTVQIQRGWVELRVINRTNLSQHRAMSGNITMPWKSDALEGSVENCCIISLTLLDEIQKPFWCVSSPIRVTMVKKTPSSDYSGEHFAMDYQNPEGQVKMSLVWLKEQKQFFLISLIIYVPVFKVNKHFSTEY